MSLPLAARIRLFWSSGGASSSVGRFSNERIAWWVTTPIPPMSGSTMPAETRPVTVDPTSRAKTLRPKRSTLTACPRDPGADTLPGDPTAHRQESVNKPS